MTSGRDELRLVSHFPGRLRVRADAFRGASEVVDGVAARVEAEPGVTEVRTSPTTGSLLVLYDPRLLELPRLVEILVSAGGLRGIAVDADSFRGGPTQGARVRERLGEWNAALRDASSGKLDLRMAVPGALAAASVTFLFTRARRLPEWYDLAMWAFTTFTTLNRGDEPDDRADPA